MRHLRILCAVARAGSLNRAAADLGLPQPALSRQLRRIEVLFGGPLFARDHRGVRPTLLGAAVLHRAEEVVVRFDDLSEQLKVQFRRRRPLTVGWATSTFHASLLRCMDSLSLSAERPSAVMTTSSRELDDLLRAGEIDLALVDREGSEPSLSEAGIDEVAWGRSPVVLALPAGHPLLELTTLSMGHLSEEHWISCTGPDNCLEQLRALCARYGFEPRVSHDVTVTGPRCDLVCHGSVALTQAVRPAKTGVVRRAVADLRFDARHALAFRTDSPIAPQIPTLVAMLAARHREVLAATPYMPAHRADGPAPLPGALRPAPSSPEEVPGIHRTFGPVEALAAGSRAVR